MANLDYGFFEALTGPIQAAGQIQQQRDALALQQQQQAQQQRAMELQALNRNQAMQAQLTKATEAAAADLYTKNNFARQKDIDDFRDWHNTLSGWSEIQEVLRTHGSVDNARLYGNLDYLIQEYKAKIADNPISRRVNKNKAALELYHSYALDVDGNAQFLTEGSKTGYKQYLDGTTDNFIFYGPRKDYLGVAQQQSIQSDQIDLEEVLYEPSNYAAIHADMINDANAPTDTRYTDAQMLAWLRKELKVTTQGGKDYFGGSPLFGEKEIDTDANSEITRMLDATNKTGIIRGEDYFSILSLEKGESYEELFNLRGIGNEWNRFGGYDPTQTTKSYVGSTFTDGRKVISGGRIFVNKGMEDNIAEVMFGKDGNVSKYVSSDRSLNGINMRNTFTSRGNQITQEDLDGGWYGDVPFIEDATGEDEFMDLKLNGFFVALKATGADGTEILLTDFEDDEERRKLANEYKDVVFQPVIVAEMLDEDLLTYDDVYYKELDMADMNVRMALNERINPEKINEVLGQSASYEQEVERNKMINNRKNIADAKLQKSLKMDNIESVDQLITGYDQSLTSTLGLSAVPAVKIQAAVPMIISDLYVTSQKERTYPYDFTPNETDPNKKMIANSPGQYMAYSTRILQEGLISGDPSFDAMLSAIKTGNYAEYSRSLYSEKDYNLSRKISKGIVQRQRGS